MTTPANPPDDFEVAKSVFEKLKDVSRERQERVLRWVAEGLGVTIPVTVPSGMPAHVSPLLSDLSHAQPSARAISEPARDIKSFVEAKNPRSDQQFAATVAYYYRFEAPPAERKETINARVVQEAARLVGRKRLTNPKATLNNAKNSGYLDNKERGEFAINTVGENLVVMTLPGDGKPETSSRRNAEIKFSANVRCAQSAGNGL
jgi:hypothetical protein